MVAEAIANETANINIKVGELKPHYFSVFHFYPLCLRKIERVDQRVVRRCHNTCSKDCFQKKTQEIEIIPHSPSLPQPSAEHSVVCIGCQSPAPVTELCPQVMSTSHWPQQQVPTTPRWMSIKFSLWQSRPPGIVHGWPGDGRSGKRQVDPDVKS